MENIEINHLGGSEYGVTLTEGSNTTHHRVRVPQHLRDDIGMVDADEERMVRESFDFLLEREQAESILPEFELDVISRYFPEYVDELGTRMNS